MSNEAELEKTVSVPLIWQSPRDLPTIYANDVYVTHAGREFQMVFGEMQLPVVNQDIGESVEVKPVAKIVVSYGMMEVLLRTLATNFETWQRKRGVTINDVN